VFAVYLLGLAEWLFQITKPSFMSALSLGEAFQVLLVSPLYPLALLLPLQALVALLPLAWPAAVIPGAVHSATALLLADNFAYTVFGVGVVSLAGSARWVCAALWLATFLLIVWRRALLAALASAGVRVAATDAPAALGAVPASVHRRPDILFITLDATEATHTSLLGYPRETTPTLDRLAATSLVAENAFSNNCYTTGALLGLLSGQRPTDFRVFYPPMTLQGAHAYQHLPAILRRLGYRTAQFTPRYWATAPWQGMRDAFDVVNGADIRDEELPLLPATVADRLPAERYFVMQTCARVLERAWHLLGIEDMAQPMDVARNRVRGEDMGDASRVGGAIRFLEADPDQPAFVQVHLMRGHCCRYVVPRQARKYSLAADGRVPDVVDVYDDVIRLMDADVGKIVTLLERYGRLDDVLLVVTADHGMRWHTDARVPLLIRFPGGEPHGRISVNAQLADVAPTVLEHLGVPPPPWMTGQSLLQPARLDPRRPIISAARVETSPFHIPGPPLFGLHALAATVCDRRYELDLTTGALATAAVAGHTASCPPGDQPPPAAVQALLTEHLAARGFGVPVP
jgi:arylsulfatase